MNSNGFVMHWAYCLAPLILLKGVIKRCKMIKYFRIGFALIIISTTSIALASLSDAIHAPKALQPEISPRFHPAEKDVSRNAIPSAQSAKTQSAQLPLSAVQKSENSKTVDCSSDEALDNLGSCKAPIQTKHHHLKKK